ncbi:hypothetical protein [Azospirillum brasilense]|uniref:hypothetical protein n=1 Tax=Azospirillum brasilense TaxID=192 RepID=UPI000A717AC2|nr:hypothetical protein [Azospirillum brasilense]
MFSCTSTSEEEHSANRPKAAAGAPWLAAMACTSARPPGAVIWSNLYRSVAALVSA